MMTWQRRLLPWLLVDVLANMHADLAGGSERGSGHVARPGLILTARSTLHIHNDTHHAEPHGSCSSIAQFTVHSRSLDDEVLSYPLTCGYGFDNSINLQQPTAPLWQKTGAILYAGLLVCLAVDCAPNDRDISDEIIMSLCSIVVMSIHTKLIICAVMHPALLGADEVSAGKMAARE